MKLISYCSLVHMYVVMLISTQDMYISLNKMCMKAAIHHPTISGHIMSITIMLCFKSIQPCNKVAALLVTRSFQSYYKAVYYKVVTVLLNQAHARRRPACAWFLEIVFVKTSVCVCVCVCMCPPPRLLKTIHVK